MQTLERLPRSRPVETTSLVARVLTLTRDGSHLTAVKMTWRYAHTMASEGMPVPQTAFENQAIMESSREAGGQIWRCGPCIVDLQHERLTRDNTPIRIRPKAWVLLVRLLQTPNSLVQSSALYQALWPRQNISPKALTNVVSELRSALGDGSVLRSVARRGFVLAASPLEQVPAVQAAPITSAPPGAATGTMAISKLHVERADLEAKLMHQAGQALAGRPQFVELVGEAGAGKTTLVERLREKLAAEAAHWTILSGRALNVGVEPEPFGPVVGLIGQRLSSHDAADVLDELRDWAPCWLLQFRGLLDPSELSGLHLELRFAGPGRILREGVALALHWANSTPLLLILEDLHWADVSTIDWLLELMRSCTTQRLFVLATRRPKPATMATARVSAEIAQRAAAGMGASILVPGFGLDSIVDYLALRGLARGTAKRLAPSLATATAGLPFYLKVAADEMTSRTRDLDAMPDPSHLVADSASHFTQHFRLRTAGLPIEARSILELCSCVAVAVPLPLLSSCLELPEVKLLQFSDELRRMGLLDHDDEAYVWQGSKLVKSFRLSHELFRDVLRSESPADRWQAMNRRLATVLQSHMEHLQADWSTHLAIAYANGAMPAEAVEAFRLSCARSLGRLAVRSAKGALQQAMLNLDRLLPSAEIDALRLELLWELARVVTLENGTMHPEVEAVREQILSFSAHIDSPPPRTAFIVAETRCSRDVYSGRGDLAESSAQTLLKSVVDQDGIELAHAFMWAGSAAMARGQLRIADLHLRRSVELSKGAKGNLATEIRLHASVHRAWSLAMMGRIEEFMSAVESLDREANSSRSSYIKAVLNFWVADAFRQLGCGDSAISRYSALSDVCEFHDIAIFRLEARVGHLLCPAPKDRDLGQLTNILASGTSAQKKFTAYKLVVGVIETLVALGKQDEARKLLNESREIGVHWPFHGSELLRLAGDLEDQAGHVAEASALWRDAMAIDLRVEFVPGLIRTLSRLSPNALHRISGPPAHQDILSALEKFTRSAAKYPEWKSSIAKLKDQMALQCG